MGMKRIRNKSYNCSKFYPLILQLYNTFLLDDTICILFVLIGTFKCKQRTFEHGFTFESVFKHNYTDVQ